MHVLHLAPIIRVRVLDRLLNLGLVHVPDLKRVVHPARDNLGGLNVEVLHNPVSPGTNGQWSGGHGGERGAQSKMVVVRALTALKTSSRWPFSPPKMTTQTCVLMFQNRMEWSGKTWYAARTDGG